MVFPVIMYGCESWTIKKAEHQRNYALELWCWRRLLRVPWTARRSNQSILKEISPEWSLKGLMLKLKLQYFGHLMWITDSLEKTLMLGKIEGKRRAATEDETVRQHHQLNGHEFEQTPGDSEGNACCSLLLLLSHISRVRICVTPEMAAHQASLSLGFSRQEHWSGLPFPSPVHESVKWKWSCSVGSDS